MLPFEHHISITPDDIDDLGHVNNVVYVRWVQEVAAAHWNSIADDRLKSQYLWVVLRHEIDYRIACVWRDEVIGTTWVGNHYGARFERFVKLTSPDGRIFAEAKTMWCLLDRRSLRPLRIPQSVLELL